MTIETEIKGFCSINLEGTASLRILREVNICSAIRVRNIGSAVPRRPPDRLTGAGMVADIGMGLAADGMGMGRRQGPCGHREYSHNHDDGEQYAQNSLFHNFFPPCLCIERSIRFRVSLKRWGAGSP